MVVPCLFLNFFLLKNANNYIQVSSGLENNQHWERFSMKIQNFPERDRLCVLCMDELSQKANLFYKVEQDKIVGIVSATFCAGCVQAVQSSTVLLIKGIFSK
jgi:hypothetical protein